MLLSSSPHTSSPPPHLFPSTTLHRHRRRPPRRPSEFRCQSGLQNLFNSLTSAPPLALLAPIFGLASATALLHRSTRPPVAADWILLTSPTPFNRSVLHRCPSVSFEEERRYVSLIRGRVPARDERGLGFGEELEFQRVCVRADDGGVICMDWPDYLDLEREQGLDTTVLIVAGTPEGSMDGKVRLLVLDVVRHGCFPIVLNPRGCAGSAVTTAR